MNLLELFVKVGIKDEATAGVNNLSSNLKGNLVTAAKAGAVAVTAITGAVTAFSGACVAAVKDVAAYGDEIDKNSQKMGMSAEAYQEWDEVMKHSGTSMETMKASMKTLANAAETGNEAFQRLGLSQEQVASMSQEELFEATIKGLQNVTDETERTYLAGQLMGRGATELGALLNMTSEETDQMRQRVHELGGVLSDEAVKAAAAFQDSLQDMHTALEGLKNKMVAEFLPAMTQVTDGLTEIFAGNIEEGSKMIDEGVDAIVDKVTEMLPKVLEIAGAILGALISSFIENLPKLVDTFLGAIADMLEGFADNTDAFVEGAANFIGGIITAIVNNAPRIIMALGKLLINLVASIASHIPDMLMAAGELVMNLAKGIADGVVAIANAAGQLMKSFIDGIGQFFGKVFEMGANLIKGLIDGIISGIANLGKALVDGVGGAIGGLAHFLGIASPSKLMMRYGRFTAQGLAEGIAAGMPDVEDAVGGMMGLFDEQPTMYFGVSAKASSSSDSGQQAAQGDGIAIYVTVEGRDGEDDFELGRRIGREAAYALRMQGVAA